MSAVKHFVASLRGRSVKLRVGDSTEKFASNAELARFLGTRLAVPAERMQEFSSMDQRTLQREARKMMQAHQNVMDLVVNAKENGESLGSLWRRLDISKVPDDHDWPSILFELGNGEHVAEGYLHEALSHYMRFLDARRDALDRFRPRQERHDDDDISLTVAPHRKAARDSDAAPASPLDDYARLPHSHMVEVDIDDKPDVTVFLGTNRYHLTRQGDDVILKEDMEGNVYPLKPGRNTVGRSSHCDVHLDTRNSDVSRQHLVVEVTPSRRVSLLDLSSRGTYVRPALLGNIRNDTVTEQRP